jgi:hypothetical protein
MVIDRVCCFFWEWKLEGSCKEEFVNLRTGHVNEGLRCFFCGSCHEALNMWGCTGIIGQVQGEGSKLHWSCYHGLWNFHAHGVAFYCCLRAANEARICTELRNEGFKDWGVEPHLLSCLVGAKDWKGVMIFTLPSRFSCNMWILYDPLWTISSWVHLGRIDVMWIIWAYMSIAYISCQYFYCWQSTWRELRKKPPGGDVFQQTRENGITTAAQCNEHWWFPDAHLIEISFRCLWLVLFNTWFTSSQGMGVRNINLQFLKKS